MSSSETDISPENSTSKIRDETVLAQSAKGATYFIILQIVSRAFTFVMNQILLRYLSLKTLGLSAQLDIFSISILYFSRESLRVALQRQGGCNDEYTTEHSVSGKTEGDSRTVATSYRYSRRLQEVINLSHVATAIGIPLTVIFQWLYSKNADATVQQTPHLHTSLNIYALATILELVNEPAFAIAGQQMLYGTRTLAEGFATFTRCLVNCSIAIWAGRTGNNLGVFPFAMGQLSYAVILNIVYFTNIYPMCKQNAISLLPRAVGSNRDYVFSRFSRSLLTIAATLYGQSIFKQFQTSGDGYLISALAPLSSQGAYALASNYGSIVARVLFQPIEESSRSLFARLLPPQSTSPDRSTKSTFSSSVMQATTRLTTLLRLYLLLSLLACTLGPPLSPIALSLVAGLRWVNTEAPSVLAAYCYYIPLLAINGILEAFVSAVAMPTDIKAQTWWSAVFSGVFASTGWVVLRELRWGARGLVVCAGINMGLRIWWSWGFVRAYLGSVDVAGGREGKRLNLWEMMPSTGSLAVGVGARLCLEKLAINGPSFGIRELTQSGLVIGFCGLGISVYERKFLLSLLSNSIVGRYAILRKLGSKGSDGHSKKG